MILLLGLPFGLGLGSILGGRVGALGALHLRAEPLLILMLMAQVALPRLSVGDDLGRVLFWGWALTFPLAAAICFANLRIPGMAVAGMGVALNAVAVLCNSGMPVLPSAAVEAGGSLAAIGTGDFAHALMTSRTFAPMLADAIPLPGPPGIRGVASAGDVMLACGVVVVIAAGMLGRARQSNGSTAGDWAATQK